MAKRNSNAAADGRKEKARPLATLAQKLMMEFSAGVFLPPREPFESVMERLKTKYENDAKKYINNAGAALAREEIKDELSKIVRTLSEMALRVEAIRVPTNNPTNNQMGFLSPNELARLPLMGAMEHAAIVSEITSSVSSMMSGDLLMPLKEASDRFRETGDCLRLKLEGNPELAALTALWQAKAGRPDMLADRMEKGLAGPAELQTAADILRGVAQNEWSYDETIRNLCIWQYVRACKFWGVSQKVGISFVTEKYGIKERQVYDILKKMDALFS